MRDHHTTSASWPWTLPNRGSVRGLCACDLNRVSGTGRMRDHIWSGPVTGETRRTGMQKRDLSRKFAEAQFWSERGLFVLAALNLRMGAKWRLEAIVQRARDAGVGGEGESVGVLAAKIDEAEDAAVTRWMEAHWQPTPPEWFRRIAIEVVLLPPDPIVPPPSLVSRLPPPRHRSQRPGSGCRTQDAQRGIHGASRCLSRSNLRRPEATSAGVPALRVDRTVSVRTGIARDDCQGRQRHGNSRHIGRQWGRASD